MVKLDARKSGSFKIGGDIEIHRLGFGAMRITSPQMRCGICHSASPSDELKSPQAQEWS